MTAGIENFQVATPDAYAGATPNWKRRMLAAQLLQQQAQTGDKVYGNTFGMGKLLASALGGWMEGKEEKKVAEQIAEADRLMPLPSSGTSAPGAQSSSTGGGNAIKSYSTSIGNVPDPEGTSGDEIKSRNASNDAISKYGEAIAAKESGGRYDIVGPTHPQYGRALGKYQVMEANVPQWTEAALGKRLSGDEFLASPDAQDRVFRHRFGSYVDEHGPEGAAAKWFTGSATPKPGVKDSLGTTASNYVSSFRNNLAKEGVAPPDEPTTPDPRAAGQIASLAGTMVPPGAPKAAPVPGPSMAPPDLTSTIVIDGATGKSIPATAARLDTSAIDRANPPRSQMTPQAPTQAPPAPQQMAQAQSQPRSQAPAAVSQTAPGATPEEIAFARVIVRNQALGIPVSPVHAQMAKDILSPVWEKLNDGTLYNKHKGQFIEAPKQPYTIAEGAQRRGKNDEILAQNIPAPEVPMTPEQRQAFNVAQGQAAGVDGRGKVHYGPASPQINLPGAEKEEDKGRGKGLSDRLNKVAEDGDAAIQDNITIKRMSQLSTSIEPGRKTALLEEIRGRTGITLDPNADNVQAFKAMINYMKPRMRVAGSGTSSDRDMAAFEGSLPQMTATPGGNELIVQTLGGMAEFRQQRGEIAQLWQLGEISAKEANQRMAKLGDPFASFKQWQDANKPAAAATEGAPKNSGEGGPITIQSPADAHKLKPGTHYRNPAGEEFIR